MVALAPARLTSFGHTCFCCIAALIWWRLQQQLLHEFLPSWTAMPHTLPHQGFMTARRAACWPLKANRQQTKRTRFVFVWPLKTVVKNSGAGVCFTYSSGPCQHLGETYAHFSILYVLLCFFGVQPSSYLGPRLFFSRGAAACASAGRSLRSQQDLSQRTQGSNTSQGAFATT